MRYTIGRAAVLAAMLLTGCSTPVVMLKNEATGQIARCGGGSAGSIAGGYIGYSIEVDDDERCVQDLEAAGFRRWHTGVVASAPASTGLPPGRIKCRFPNGTIVTTDDIACAGSLQGEIVR